MKNKVLQNIIDVISDPHIKKMKWKKNTDNSWSTGFIVNNGSLTYICDCSFHVYDGIKMLLNDILLEGKSILEYDREDSALNDHFLNLISDSEHESYKILELYKTLSKIGQVRYLAPEYYNEFIKKVDRILLAGLE
jgi:hypothetical protein